ncbi:hypothetical protein CALCODRAFT_420779, partial [Calocera cornea HHB12733]
RTHSLAMSLQWLETMIQWSETVVPRIDLELPLKLPDDIRKRKEMCSHLFMRAFSVGSWTLWTRSAELTQLRWQDIELGLVDDTTPPHRLPYFTVRLRNRKGWQ